MKHFHCIGSSCSDTCCKNWRINIDEDTYFKYRQINDADIKKLIDTHIVSAGETDQCKAIYGGINLAPDGVCPFIDDEGLCSLQVRYGSDYLSNACAMYPRITNFVNGACEQCGDMSCPEIATLALMNPARMSFEIEEVDYDRIDKGLFFIVIDNRSDDVVSELIDFLAELRLFSFSLIQNRKYSVSDRLLLLGMLYSGMQKDLNLPNVESLRAYLESRRQTYADGSIEGALAGVAGDVDFQMEMLLSLMTAYRGIAGPKSRRYEVMFSHVVDGLMLGGHVDRIAIIDNYKTIYGEYYKSFDDHYGYILENFLVNDMFRYVAPLRNVGENTVFSDYVRLVLKYALIRIHLVGIAGHSKGLSAESAVSAIQLVTREVETNRAYTEWVDGFVGADKTYNMARIALLLNN